MMKYQTVTIRDCTQQIIVSTFGFAAHSNFCNKDVRVTGGCFDIVFDCH